MKMKNYRNLSAKLNQRITIEEAIETPDDKGGFITAWSPKMIVWAEISPISAHQNFETHKIEDVVSHIIIMRFIEGVDTKMRIKYNDRIFNIKGIINVREKNRILKIKTEEVLQQ